MKRQAITLLILLVCFFCTAVARAQTPLVLPSGVLQAVTGAASETSVAPQNVLAAQNVVPKYVCRSAAALEGTKLISVPGVGNVTVRSVVVGRGKTIEGKNGYWQEYAAAGSPEIAGKKAYLAAVKNLNPQIADLNRVCAGDVIILPAVANLKVAVDRERLMALERSAAQIDELQRAVFGLQVRMIDMQAELRSEDDQRLATQRMLDVLQRAVVQGDLERARMKRQIVDLAETQANDRRELEAELGNYLSAIVILDQEIADLSKRHTTLEQNLTDARSALATADKNILRLQRAVVLFGFAILGLGVALIIVALVMLWRGRRQEPRRSLIDTLPTSLVQKQAASQEPTHIVAEHGTPTLQFHCSNGKELEVEVVQVSARCGALVGVEHLQDHEDHCDACPQARMVLWHTNIPRGYLPHENNQKVVEALKVVSAKAPCGTPVKLRNFENHMTHCADEQCRNVFETAAVSLAVTTE